MANASHNQLLALGILSIGLLRACYMEQEIDEPEVQVVSEEVLEFDQVFAFTDLKSKLLLYPLPSDILAIL